MITEEQLKKVLDSLRLNIYDTPAYKVITNLYSISIENKESKSILEIYIRTHKHHYWPFNIHFTTKLRRPRATIYKRMVDECGTYDEIIISKELASSFISYITERLEQDKLICETNVNSEFNL